MSRPKRKRRSLWQIVVFLLLALMRSWTSSCTP